MSHYGHKLNCSRAVTFVVCLLGLASLTYAEQTGVTRDNVDMRAAPYRDANLITQLPKETKVSVIGRRGGWAKINIEAHGQGWVRLHKIRLGDSTEHKKSSFLGISRLWRSATTGRSGATGLTATTGIRGMDDKALKDAKPNPEALKSLETFQAGEDAAAVDAQSAGLVKQDIKDADLKKINKKRKKNKKKKKKKRKQEN